MSEQTQQPQQVEAKPQRQYPPTPKNEIRVKNTRNMKPYIKYVMSLLRPFENQGPAYDEVIIKGMGKAAAAAVHLSEIVKSLFEQKLFQLTEVHSTKVIDQPSESNPEDEPAVEYIPSITVTLSKKDFSSNTHIGYQGPGTVPIEDTQVNQQSEQKYKKKRKPRPKKGPKPAITQDNVEEEQINQPQTTQAPRPRNYRNRNHQNRNPQYAPEHYAPEQFDDQQLVQGDQNGSYRGRRNFRVSTRGGQRGNFRGGYRGGYNGDYAQNNENVYNGQYQDNYQERGNRNSYRGRGNGRGRGRGAPREPRNGERYQRNQNNQQQEDN